jgi:hypothetical protein
MSRRQVGRMVEGDKSMIAFTRTAMVEDGEGGHIEGVAVTLPAQKVTILPFKKRLVDGIAVTEFGQIPSQAKTLLGEVGLDIQINDLLYWRGSQYRVAEIEPILDDIHTIARLDMLGGEDIHA